MYSLSRVNSFVVWLSLVAAVPLAAQPRFAQMFEYEPDYLASDSLVLSESPAYVARLESFTSAQLRFARNLIFAKRGYVFRSRDLDKYFRSTHWYRPRQEPLRLTVADSLNIAFLLELEAAVAQPGTLSRYFPRVEPPFAIECVSSSAETILPAKHVQHYVDPDYLFEGHGLNVHLPVARVDVNGGVLLLVGVKEHKPVGHQTFYAVTVTRQGDLLDYEAFNAHPTCGDVDASAGYHDYTLSIETDHSVSVEETFVEIVDPVSFEEKRHAPKKSRLRVDQEGRLQWE